jgi:hypothetical protein
MMTSDVDSYHMAPLWGTEYDGSTGKYYNCRLDMGVIEAMGANLIRLYDWDPRNDHIRFLDFCQKNNGIVVLFSVSNYLDQGLSNWKENIPALIKSFSKPYGSDYHPA